MSQGETSCKNYGDCNHGIPVDECSKMCPHYDSKVCQWAKYKGLWHRQCRSFLTTTTYGEENYTSDELPWDGKCLDCGKEVEVVDRQFGRNF